MGRGSGGFRRPAARPQTWCRSQDSCPVTLRPHARGGGRGHFRGHGPHGPSLRPQSAPLFPCRVCRAPFPRPLRVGPLSWPNTSSMRVLRPHLGVPKVCLSFLLSCDEPPLRQAQQQQQQPRLALPTGRHLGGARREGCLCSKWHQWWSLEGLENTPWVAHSQLAGLGSCPGKVGARCWSPRPHQPPGLPHATAAAFPGRMHKAEAQHFMI